MMQIKLLKKADKQTEHNLYGMNKNIKMSLKTSYQSY